MTSAPHTFCMPETPGMTLYSSINSLETASMTFETEQLAFGNCTRLNAGASDTSVASITPTRLTLPPLPPMTVPLAPAASWVGGLGVLSPVHMLSPILAPFLGFSPTVPISAPLPDSARRPDSDGEGTFQCSDRLIIVPRNADVVDKEKKSAESSSKIGPQGTLKDLKKMPVVKLSMPPKHIKRRTATVVQSPRRMVEYDECAEQYTSQDDGVERTADFKIKQETSNSAISAPFKFRVPRGKSHRMLQRAKYNNAPTQRTMMSWDNKERCLKDCDPAPGPPNYEYIWEDQRDAACEQLNDIGFAVRTLGRDRYACSLCSDVFSSRMFVVRHALRFHVHGKPFSCQMCFRRFTRSDSLVRHVKRKHGVI